jgi:hypothetical protein
MNDEPATIRIKLNIAIKRSGPDFNPGWERIGNMFRQVGNSDTYMVPPGEVFEIEREEGLRLVARFGGEVIERSGP